MEIGEKIRRARQAKNLTQQELGDMVGVQKSAIAKYEFIFHFDSTSLNAVKKKRGSNISPNRFIRLGDVQYARYVTRACLEVFHFHVACR